MSFCYTIFNLRGLSQSDWKIVDIIIIYRNYNNNNNEKLVLRHKMQMQTQAVHASQQPWD